MRQFQSICPAKFFLLLQQGLRSFAVCVKELYVIRKTQYCLMCRAASFSFFPEDGANKFLQKVGKCLPDYTASYTKYGIVYEDHEMLTFCLRRLYKHFATCFQRSVFTSRNGFFLWVYTTTGWWPHKSAETCSNSEYMIFIVLRYSHLVISMYLVFTGLEVNKNVVFCFWRYLSEAEIFVLFLLSSAWPRSAGACTQYEWWSDTNIYIIFTVLLKYWQ